MSNEFYVLYLDKRGNRMGYVNSYKNAGIQNIWEAEEYWTNLFNPRCYGLTFVKATESRLDYEQWKRGR